MANIHQLQTMPKTLLSYQLVLIPFFYWVLLCWESGGCRRNAGETNDNDIVTGDARR